LSVTIYGGLYWLSMGCTKYLMHYFVQNDFRIEQQPNNCESSEKNFFKFIAQLFTWNRCIRTHFSQFVIDHILCSPSGPHSKLEVIRVLPTFRPLPSI
jgi:hypothetical protein